MHRLLSAGAGVLIVLGLTSVAGGLQPPAAAVPATTPPTSATSAEAHAIRFSRPHRAGDRFRLEGNGTQSQVMALSFDGEAQAPERNELTVRMVANAQVTAVDAIGRPTAMSYVVEQCTMVLNGAETMIAPEGATITSSFEAGNTRFELDGFRLGGEASAALQIVAGLDAEGPSEDDILGSKTPRTIGETWPIDVDRAIEKLQPAVKTSVPADALSGATTLVGAMMREGQPCVQTRSRIESTGAIPGLGGAPAGLEVRDSHMVMTMDRIMPVEPDAPVIEDQLRLAIDVVFGTAPGPDTQSVEMQVGVIQTATLVTRPLAAAAVVAEPDLPPAE